MAAVTVSPPKPWERAQAAGAAPSSTSTALATTNSTIASTAAPSTISSANSASSAPAVPQRPSSLNSVVNRTASSYTNPQNTAYNRPYSSAYSSPYSSMSSPYGGMSRFGSYGGMGSMYGGMGGYGMGGYGMGGMHGGMGGMGGMYGQQQGDPNDPNSMTQNFAQSTQATFQIIESIVGAFGGFAQMLESTYMATHSSFFAMINVADQFSTLKQTLGSVLGIYALLRWIRTIFAKLTGRPPPADATALTPAAFSSFMGNSQDPALPPGMTRGPDGRPVAKPSKKPFIVFLLAVFGLPYLMGKVIRALAKSAEQNQGHQHIPGMAYDQQGQPLPIHMQPPHVQQQLQQQQTNPQQTQSRPLDPSKLDFCRVLYDFPPPDAVNTNPDIDLVVKKGDLVAVLDKSDPDGKGEDSEGAWWRCRARDGRMGYLPRVYLETIQRRREIEGGERANSMPTKSGPVHVDTETTKGSPPQSRAQTMDAKTGQGKAVTDFQKGWGTGQ